MSLSVDPLWPRAGDWPTPVGALDAVLIGVPTWRTSLSSSGAHATPGALWVLELLAGLTVRA